MPDWTRNGFGFCGTFRGSLDEIVKRATSSGVDRGGPAFLSAKEVEVGSNSEYVWRERSKAFENSRVGDASGLNGPMTSQLCRSFISRGTTPARSNDDFSLPLIS